MNKEEDALVLLKKHKLRNTEIRRAVLCAFMQVEHALDHAALEDQLGQHVDRVTLYRTLKSFEAKGLIHRIANEKGTLEYGLCQGYCSHQEEHLQHKHSDEHVHFHCQRCNKTLCLNEQKLPKFDMPKGYSAEDVQILINGTCPDCA